MVHCPSSMIWRFALLSPNGIKTILFDLDGTLRHNLPTGGEVFSGQMISLGLPVTPADRLRSTRWEHEYWAGSSDLFSDLSIYEENSPDFWLNYSRRQLISFGAEEVRAQELAPVISKYMWDSYKPESVPTPESPTVLAQLKQAGFKLGVVSNREHPFVDELERIGLSQFIDFSMAAGEIQIYKPEPGIFEAALKRMN